MRLRYFLLLIFLILSLGPLALFRAWPHSDVLQGELDEVHERHLLLARNLATALERYHQDVVTTFDLFLDKSEDWSTAASFNRVLDNLDFRHVCIADWNTGRVVRRLALANFPCPDVVPAATLDRLRGLAATDAVAFGPVVPAPDGENVIHLVKRVGDYLAIGAIRTTYFQELGEAISFGVMGHAAIVDHTGQALSHPLADWVAVRKDMSKISAVARMLNRETGVETFYSPALEGDMIAGFTFVDPVGWGVMIPQPLSELYQKAEEAQRSGLIVLLIGTVFALSLAMLISLRVVRPLEQVTRSAGNISDGDFSLPGKQRHSRFLPIELNELHQRFHEMVLRLRDGMATIHTLAYADPVTGLGNRTYFQMQCDLVLKRQFPGALLLIDLDDFKAVNDMHGHDAGDALLELVGLRICTTLGIDRLSDQAEDILASKVDAQKSGFVARLGGDEFAVWVPIAQKNDLRDVARQIISQLQQPFVIGSIEARIGASVGVAIHPTHAKTRGELVKAADLAMYRAKRAGKGRYTFFVEELRTAMVAQRRLGHEIERGLSQGQFLPYFQPQFRLPDRKITGVEALARWNHPERGLLGPSLFLEAAQDVGLLQDLDAQILQKSVDQLSELSEKGLEVGSLALNVSEERLRSPAFVDAVERLPELAFELRFELVEAMVLDKVEGRLAWTLDRIRAQGHGFDLDDFGAANASVLGLMNVEPAHLKIDRKLIAGLTPGTIPERLVTSIIEMGHCLGIPIIAEGAEDLETVAILEKLGCDFVQGYALARPMSMLNLAAFMRGDAAATPVRAMKGASTRR